PNVNLLGLALAGATAGPTDPSVSSVEAFSAVPFAPFSGSVPADGSTKVSIVVGLRDANNALVTGKNVVLSATPGGHAVIMPSSGVSTAANGAVIFSVTNAIVETTTFTATVDGVNLTQTATVNFIGPPPASAGISASLPAVTADGIASSTITVTLLDGQGH